MELNYAGIINAGQGLVGDLQEQMMMQDQRKQQQQARALQVQQAQQSQARQGAFNQRLAQITQSQRYGDIPALMLEFPDYADQLKPGYDALSKDAKARNLTQIGTITRRATAGDVTGAIDMLRSRVEADKAAGEDTTEEEEAIRMLSSDDPLQRQAAISTLHMLTYNADPDGYKVLFPADAKSSWKKEYDDRVATFGKAAADQWAATQDEKFIPVQAGGSVFRATDLMPPQTAEGGDQSAGGGGPNGDATLSPQQYQAVVDTRGKAWTDNWVRENGLTVGGAMAAQSTKTVSGKTYYQINGRWFDNPEGR